ncbi:type II toxin-antitoxin system HipA family toxin [Mucilaginibacter sp. 10I4]|uniref:type II toxin-antitoxin system HipA family toxin n=1 Tax=Mucilaginibacter sp. 10I4 TaxID=3048580 RepID=UPI002B22815C|nr:type II toxin-antitoxin system HipA family toxin [Mucilaginibacter sp. 10I4]MEB0261793.1 type II toxin-antitoxin system HipA family toxin [Mucilaginibacter sp. 10I4]
MINSAFINIWGERVGAIAWDADNGVANFEFEPTFLRMGWDIAPLKMPVAAANGKIFSFNELRGSQTFKGLPGLLADVLPDRYGNTLINTWLARVGRPADSMNPVEMLCFIGQRGMGALEFEPVEPKGKNTSTKLEVNSLVEISEAILSGRKDFHTDLSKDEEKGLLDILKIGTSAGGARAKAVIAYNPKTGEVRSGQAEAPKGFTQWLIKFDGVHDAQFGTSRDYGRVEMAYHLMAVDCGIEMTECRLLEEHGRAHFMTRRFDRIPDQGKIHVQTFCALQHFDFNNVGSYSYEQLFQTMRSLRLDYPQAEQIYRRMVFNVLARNCDDHTKNFAFTMDKKGQWALAPAYDICHAYRPDSPWVSQQSLSVNGKRQGIDRKDLLEVAKQMTIKKPDEIIRDVESVLKLWPDYANQCDVATVLQKAIAETFISLKV